MAKKEPYNREHIERMAIVLLDGGEVTESYKGKHYIFAFNGNYKNPDLTCIPEGADTIIVPEDIQTQIFNKYDTDKKGFFDIMMRVKEKGGQVNYLLKKSMNVDNVRLRSLFYLASKCIPENEILSGEADELEIFSHMAKKPLLKKYRKKSTDPMMILKMIESDIAAIGKNPKFYLKEQGALA